jgi:hypothetical protein
MFDSQILLARFLVLYRLYRQIQSPDLTSQFQMNLEVTGPGLTNSCYPRSISDTAKKTLSYPDAEAYSARIAKLCSDGFKTLRCLRGHVPGSPYKCGLPLYHTSA